jgi:hypothetical protein
LDSEEDTSCCCCCTGSGNKNRGHRRKAKKGRFCSCFGDSNPPREFEDEIYSEICSNNHSGKGYFLVVKNTKKGFKRQIRLKKAKKGQRRPKKAVCVPVLVTQIHQENLRTKFTLKYAPIIIQVKIDF